MKANFVHAVDGTVMKLVYTDNRGRQYWKKTSYKGKTSSHTTRERNERDRVLHRRMLAEGNKAELMCLLYGGIPDSEDGKLLAAGMWSDIQRESQSHTTQGDFSHLAGNPLIFK